MPVLLPESLREACALLAEDDRRVPLAGGTDLLVNWPDRFDRQAATFIDLSQVSELKPIRWTDDFLVLGATATFWDVLVDASVAREFPMLAAAARTIGAPQIRTRGTWAGNLVTASPVADGTAVLMAFDAIVDLVSARGESSVPLAAFYPEPAGTRRRPDELVRSIRIPRRARSVQRFEKVGIRAAQVVSILSLAIARSADGWRVVAGGMAPRVTRCPGFERAIGAETPVESFEDLLPFVRADLRPEDDLRATAAYRERVFARVAFANLAEHCPWMRRRSAVETDRA